MSDIEQFHALKRQEKLLKERLDTLSKRIKDTYGPGVHRVGTVEAHVQIKRSKPKVDDVQLEQLLRDKNLWTLGCKEVPDHSCVEQMYIEGVITDDDLRAINDGSNITVALTVKDIKEEGEIDVQGNDESLC